ncbi:MAG: AAA family ATPase [Pseudobacteriovorax sp.]|nr:AAA family ATPase [Pseudobacteriovorax sp.]
MSDKKIPKPDEVQRDFEDFVKRRFDGVSQFFKSDAIDLNEHAANQDEIPEIDPTPIKEFDFTPKQIKDYLDQYVIDQDEAKRTIAIAICDHYLHAKAHQDKEITYDYKKQNVLILGPTGVGKTYLIKKAAELIDVPFVKADATRFSETGYVGGNVDDLVRELVQQADNDIAKAEFGIIYLDEADKLAGKSTGQRDVTGRGVQFGLLKLMEDADVDLRAGNDMQSQIQALMDMQSGQKKSKRVSTKHILFIVSGAFSGLEPIIEKRLKGRTIGFNRDDQKTKEESKNVFSQVTTEDFLKFGFEAEFIGRLPVRVACNPLMEDHLFHILKTSSGSPIHQYRAEFQAYGIDLKIEDDAMKAISKLAAEEAIGARGLMTVCERIMRPFKFELPEYLVTELVITEALVQNPEQALIDLMSKLSPRPKPVRADHQFIKAFSDPLYDETGVRLLITDSLSETLSEMPPSDELDLYLSIISHYRHGLALLRSKADCNELTLDVSFIEDPIADLELNTKRYIESRKSRPNSIH